MSRRVSIPIYSGDDFERLSEARRQVEIAARKAAAERAGAPLRVGDEQGDPEYLTAAQDAYDGLLDAASERAEQWVLEPIGHEEFRRLLRDHPPRKVDGEDGKPVTHPADAGWKVNTETFGKALLLYRDPEDPDIRTVVEPALSDEALRRRVKRLAAGEFDTLWMAAFQINDGGIADPKLSRFSPADLRSSGT